MTTESSHCVARHFNAVFLCHIELFEQAIEALQRWHFAFPSDVAQSLRRAGLLVPAAQRVVHTSGPRSAHARCPRAQWRLPRGHTRRRKNSHVQLAVSGLLDCAYSTRLFLKYSRHTFHKYILHPRTNGLRQLFPRPSRCNAWPRPAPERVLPPLPTWGPT